MTTYYHDRFGGADVLDAAQPLGRRILDPRVLRPLAAATVLGLLVAGAIELLTVRPLLTSRDETLAARNALALANRESEQTLVGYEEFLRQKADVDRRYEAVTEAIPTDAELASVLESVRALASGAGMQLASFSPEPPRPRAGAALEQRRVDAVVRGSFEQLKSLLRELGQFPRMLTVESVSVRESSRPGFTLEAALTVTCYSKAAPPGAR